MIKHSINHDLQKIGLGKNEVDVYLGLIELGASKAGPLSEHTEVPTSHIYPILTALHKKGLIYYKYANNVKIYCANPPETLKALYVEKQKQLDNEKKILLQSILAINKLPSKKDTFSYYKYFEGISGIVAMWQEIIAGLEANTAVDVVAGRDSAIEPFNQLFMAFQKERMNKKITQRIILPSTISKKYARERQIRGRIQIRYLDLEPDAELCIFKNCLVIQSLATEDKVPRAFLIKDTLFIEYFKMLFGVLWTSSKQKDS